MNKPSILTAIAILGFAGPGWAQPRDTAELPLSRIVLFSSGVGYFQRDGQVNGNAKIDLKFHTQNINDLLKSLVLQDLNGGQVSTVNYDNRDPIDKTLKSFAIDLTDNPSIGKLLNQVRGERVAISGQDDKGGGIELEGIVVGIEKVHKAAGKDQVIEVEQLNLLTNGGLESQLLPNIRKIRFLKPELETEFQKALQVLATSNDKGKKSVTLSFQGNGRRTVRVGYVTDSPIWKTSYRLSLDREGNKDKVFLQGWAIVENTTDEDWNNVRLGLISGRPISFQMDLYQPLYIHRPEVQLELFSSLRPPLPELGYAVITGDSPPNADEKKLLEAIRAENSRGMGFGRGGLVGGGGGFGGGGAGMAPGGGRPATQAKAAAPMDFRSSVASAAVATELGEYFKYEIEQPVSLGRQKSSLLPIAQGPVEASKISLYNESVHAKFPLLSLRVKNTTGLHLMQGPITVYESGVYAGDARIGDFQPNEKRLISYAVDQGVEVTPESPRPVEELVAMKIVKGIMQLTHKTRFTRRYIIKNRSEHDRTVMVEHPLHAERTLVAPEKPAERTSNFYRFETPVKPSGQATLDVVEDWKRRDDTLLTNLPDQTIRVFLRQAANSPKVKEALETALKLKGELEVTQKQIQDENNALKVIEQDQSRMRANMERVPQTSEAYKRYLKKFDDQETEIEKRRAAITKLQETANRQQSAYESFLTNLSVE
jgi:hypothetical protein